MISYEWWLAAWGLLILTTSSVSLIRYLRRTGNMRRRPAALRPPIAVTPQHAVAYVSVDPTITRQLRIIADSEDSSVQKLVEEGIALVLQSRGK